MILGSRLGALVREEHGELLHGEMERQRARFVQLVQEIRGVHVMRDADTGLDVLIGLDGALPPLPSEGRPSLRPDVYAAFTRYGESYCYDPDKNQFQQGMPSKGAVACPEIEQNDLNEVRRRFAETVPEPNRSALLSALDQKEESLARFREAISRTHLTKDWERFRYEMLSEKIREWATSRDLTIQADWFRRGKSARERRSGPRQLLHILADVMTDEEIRAILVPISTVERYVSQRL